MLVEEIKAASDTSNRSSIEINIMKDTVQFSSQGYSAFSFAQSAVDLEENGKSVNIEKCRFPLLIFAEMARRKHLSFGFQVQWVKDNEISTGAAISGEAEVTLNSKKLTTSYDLKITATKDLILKNPLKMLSQAPPKSMALAAIQIIEAICAKAKKFSP